MKMLKLGGLLLVLLGLTAQANAGVTALLEEPYSYDGAFAGTGHTAVYLTHVCAASPTLLRRCNPGEAGVVISRYNRIAGYDWIAIPLLPYLYAVAKPEDIPLYADAKLVAFLRNQYRQQYLEDLGPDKAPGQTPEGDWVQLIGSAYDRTSYGFQLETTSEQDDELIRWLNTRPNAKSYKVVSRNCADFVREVVNFYYPKAVSRGIFSDLDVATPKQTAKSFVKYSERHRDLEFSSFVIPQVPGSIKRSRPVRGVVESVAKAKKYVIPLAVFHPFLAGGVASVYLVGARFNPAKNVLVFNPNGDFEQPLRAEERRAYQKNLDDLLRGVPDDQTAGQKISWREFQQIAKPGFDPIGGPILQSAIADTPVSLGISRSNFFGKGGPSELQRELLVSRLRSELTAGRAPKSSNIGVRNDLEMLQQLVAAQRESITAHTDAGN
ncbi:MAG: hypothetical protein JWN92_170 [Candidatus Acidoferrum typicum]|nr:hypothetical protein [Candidatus Acidoferrum typicum]